MKKFASFLLILLLIAGAGAGVTYFISNQPETTYYPDGKVKTITARKLFKKTGDYHIFNEKGILSEKYNLVDGVKTGKAFLYGGLKPIEINYINGVLLGDVIVDKSSISNELEELKLSVKQGNLIDFTFKTKELSLIGEAKIVCPDSDFIGKYQKYSFDKNANNFKAFLGCLSFTTVTLDNESVTCQYNGEYVFPKFKTDSKFICENKPSGEEILPTLEKIKAETNYIVEKGVFVVKTSDPKNPTLELVSTFKGEEKIIESLITFSLTDKKEQNPGKLLADIIEYFTVSNSELTLNGQKISSVEGDFNLVNGFSDPYEISYFTGSHATSQINITSDSISLRLRYPVSKQPMFGLEIKVDDTVKEKYKNVVTELTAELSKGNQLNNETFTKIFAQWIDYAWEFSDVIKSVNGVLWNNNGEKILAASLNVKNKISFNNFMQNAAKNIDIKVVEYKNSNPVYIAKGTMFDGFTLNNNPADIATIMKTMQTAELDYTFKQIKEELTITYANVENDWANGNMYPVDPVLFGAYKGYVEAVKKHHINKSKEQLSTIIYNTKTLFAQQEDYAGLKNSSAKKFNIVPYEMYVLVDDNKITNIEGGNVTITTSKRRSDDADDNADAFVVEFGGLSRETCLALASEYYTEDSGLIGVAAGIQTTPNHDNTHSKIGAIASLLTSDKSNSKAIEGLAYATGTSLPFTVATGACIGENNNNAIAFKFY